MKKSLLFALAAVAMLGACNGVEKAQEKSGETTASDTTEVRTVECVANGDVVFGNKYKHEYKYTHSAYPMREAAPEQR